MRVLILDMVHGGDLLARRHLAEGDDVTCVDVYGICSQERKDELRSMEIRVADKVPEGKYDLTVMPTHCPRTFLGDADPGKIISFSQDVCRFIEDRRFRIEVTGSRGRPAPATSSPRCSPTQGRRCCCTRPAEKGRTPLKAT